ncbi:unnamed protein product [Linum tenue]|uniref:Uncharacterized protein n=1 Tax=Linum tenue TaxID=586396 RepID=A0AAV0QX55_9ROSI|nr:unnamed protein product [Linum tenue]
MAGAGAPPVSAQVEIPVETWLTSLDRKLQDSLPPSSNWRICRVPRKLQSVKKDAYSPQVISIGPFHHAADNVKPMAHHKLHYATSLLSRTPATKSTATLAACADFLRRFDATIRAYYAEKIDLNQTQLAEVLIVDSLFIIELFVRYFNVDLRLQHDPIFTSSWMILTLQRDLLLLENQIPFFVLEMLFMITVKRSAIGPSMPPLPELALLFFKSALNVDEKSSPIGGSTTWSCHHLLDLTYRSYFCPSPRLNLREESNRDLERLAAPDLVRGRGERGKKKKEKPWVLIQSAKELKTVGIKFRKVTAKHLFEMEFKDGKFRIPPLTVHDSTDSLLRNLMAYEQFSHASRQFVTSYVMLMDRLIDTKEDVQILEKAGVIENELGDSGYVSNLFNEMCKQIVFREFYYDGLCEQVNGYSKGRWQKSKAHFRSVYLKNIWTIVSLFVAAWVLAATTIQTVYSILDYNKP